MTELRKGSAVTHAHYGRGTVKAVRHHGYEAFVSFTRFRLWVPARELTVVQGGLRLVTPPEEDRDPGGARGDSSAATAFEEILSFLTSRRGRSGPPDEDDRPSRPGRTALPEPRYTAFVPGRPVADAKDIEALRLGIVPTSRVETWTVGREPEVQRMRRFLQDDAEGAILIEGAYGAGKTHLLAYLAQQAASLGFAVAMAGFDPSEAAAAFPKRAWRRLARGFAAPVDGRTLDFRGFLRALVGTPGWREVLGDHWAFGPFLRRLALDEADDSDWAWIEGRNGGGRADYPTLHDHSTCANLYCNLLSALSRAASEVFDLRGLVVLLDEAEVARSVLYSYHLHRGLNFFRGLVLTANDDPVLVEEDVVRGEMWSYGRESNLVYSGHRPVRYTAGVPSLMKVAFALTPGTLRQELKRYRDTMDFVPVDPLPPADLRRLFGLICDRFQAVFGVRLTVRDREEVYRLVCHDSRVQSTREFIKASVEALDGLRFYPQVPLGEVLSEGVGF